MNRKLEITTNIINIIPAEYRPSVESAMVQWWYNIQINGGYRLTDIGFDALCELAQLEAHIYEFNDNEILNNRHLLQLDRKLQWPYYLVTKKQDIVRIIFFDGKEAMTAKLYGNIYKFLDHYH